MVIQGQEQGMVAIGNEARKKDRKEPPSGAGRNNAMIAPFSISNWTA